MTEGEFANAGIKRGVRYVFACLWKDCFQCSRYRFSRYSQEVFPGIFCAGSRPCASPDVCTQVPRELLFFSDEPILRVTAPIIEAQLVESQLLNPLASEEVGPGNPYCTKSCAMGIALAAADTGREPRILPPANGTTAGDPEENRGKAKCIYQMRRSRGIDALPHDLDVHDLDAND